MRRDKSRRSENSTRFLRARSSCYSRRNTNERSFEEIEHSITPAFPRACTNKSAEVSRQASAIDLQTIRPPRIADRTIVTGDTRDRFNSHVSAGAPSPEMSFPQRKSSCAFPARPCGIGIRHSAHGAGARTPARRGPPRKSSIYKCRPITRRGARIDEGIARDGEKRGMISGGAWFTFSAGERAVARHDKREEARSVKVRRGVVPARDGLVAGRNNIAWRVACSSHVRAGRFPRFERERYRCCGRRS